MTLNQLQDYTFNTKYARYNKDLGRRETYPEAVERVIAMHAEKYAGKGIEAELAFVRQAMLDKLVLGSQRALQFGGKPIQQKHARIFNCTTSYCDRPRFFQETLWLLLCGSGVGFSVQRHHVAKLPDLRQPTGASVTFVVPDTIEGWADSLGVLLAAYGIAAPEFRGWVGTRVDFDLGQIRPKGATISSGSGKAPGPEPLKASLERIRVLLDSCLAAGRTRLRPIDAYDVVMHASDAVLSGGVRRSATICLFSPDDQEMVTAKTGDWFIKNPQRGRSNNSAVLLRDQTPKEDFAALMKSVKEFGEPGFVWTDSVEITYNPCVEISLFPQISLSDYTRLNSVLPPAASITGPDQLSGWAMCNLCEINAKKCSDEAIWRRACEAAAILGTLQAGYTTFDYLGPVSETIVAREALLGVSMTGVMDQPDIVLNPELQRKMATYVLEVNKRVAEKIGINPTARATCVKPAGTTSCILGTSSGIHPHHARRYFRRVQANKLETPFQYFLAHNPRAVESSVWNPNGTDAVITFCVDVPRHARTQNQMSALDLLAQVKLTQDNWVMSGRVLERCVKPWLRHNVSNTITVREDEWEAVTDYIYQNRQAFAGISILPAGGDLDYPQAPFCAVWTHDEIVKEYGVGALMASGLIVDGLRAFDNDLWAACSCALGIGEALQEPGYAGGGKDSVVTFRELHATWATKVDWVRRARQFADRYFGGDLKAMTYCLKRVHNCKLWEDLKREYVAVDYSLMMEAEDETRLAEAAACAGGRCDL